MRLSTITAKGTVEQCRIGMLQLLDFRGVVCMMVKLMVIGTREYIGSIRQTLVYRVAGLGRFMAN